MLEIIPPVHLISSLKQLSMLFYPGLISSDHGIYYIPNTYPYTVIAAYYYEPLYLITK